MHPFFQINPYNITPVSLGHLRRENFPVHGETLPGKQTQN